MTVNQRGSYEEQFMAVRIHDRPESPKICCKIISFKLYETLYILMVVGQRENTAIFR